MCYDHPLCFKLNNLEEISHDFKKHWIHELTPLPTYSTQPQNVTKPLLSFLFFNILFWVTCSIIYIFFKLYSNGAVLNSTRKPGLLSASGKILLESTELFIYLFRKYCVMSGQIWTYSDNSL